MTVFRLLVVLAFASVCSGRAIADDGELKAVIVLYRHGDRSPTSSWPNDEYFGNASLWPDGYGQLNNFGKQRQYALGQWFRNRYDGFLPARYNSSDIYIRSTDLDRTLMSAASNLAGLYPPSGDQVWSENIPWQAIPIHTMPVLQDYELVAYISCPKHDSLTEQLLNSDEFKQFFKENSELFQNISGLAGYSPDDINLDSFSELFTEITIYREFNLTLPEWTDVYWSKIKELAVKRYVVPTYTQQLARLRIGPFFSYFIDHLNSIQNQEVPKFLMLSSHESTMSDITNAMGTFPGAIPQFASSLVWEVRGKVGSNEDLILNLYFKNSTHFVPMTVPGCDFDCGLEDFATILKPIAVTPEKFTEECKEE